MSDSTTRTSLLEDFSIGNPISEHHGIRCCPAIKENTDKKYIIKIISVPATQAQMDALLLAGAYKDPSDAMDYFREQGEQLLKEAQLLRELSALEGFLSYESWQMEPITRHRLGYEISLVGSYKRSVERYMRHNAVTHLEAVNLGLDMCGALSAARQAGALYVDLKPGNIFMSDKKEYRIGDLGFLSLDSLRYAALPEKYISSYTPPELYDPMNSVNLTADTYALGMILYQLYNDGNLPFKGMAPEEGLPAPVQADYELAEIIMKAIHPDPEQRYSDPAQMGKALAEYMQRNSVNDVPITPLRTKKTKHKKKKAALSEDIRDAAFEQVNPDGEDAENTDTPHQEPPSAQEATAEPAAIEEAPEVLERAQDKQTCEDPAEETAEESLPEIPVEDTEPEDTPEEAHFEEPEEDPLEEPEEIPPEQTEEASSEEPEEPEEGARDPEEAPEAPEEERPEAPAEAVNEDSITLSEELSRIFAKADDLIAHETPRGVHIPELPELPDPFAFARDEEVDDSDIPYDPLMEEEPEAEPQKSKKEKKYIDPKYRRRRKRLFARLLALAVLVLGVMGGWWYYQNFYLLSINSMVITGDRTQITVQVDAPVDDELLSVTCSDRNGSSETKTLTNGQATFTGLQSNTIYDIALDVEGFHRLTGTTTDQFTTDATTGILTFHSVGGSENGSVILNFTVDGQEPEHWAVSYTADGEEPQRKTFTGHTVTITGLSLGKQYTFTLEAGDGTSLGGMTTLELLASRNILAENISVTSTNGSDMTVRWNSPGDVVVDSWDVRCYNDMGYDQTLTVADTQAMFTGIDPAWEYTIEVTAAGMTQPARTGITANPISIQAVSIDDSDPTALHLSWEYSGSISEEGWRVVFTVGGGERYVAQCDGASAAVNYKIPGGKYTFYIEAADGTSVFNNIHTHTAAEAQSFEGNKLTADMLTIDLLKTPEEENWYCENISDQQLTDQFQSGDSISLALRSSDSFYLPGAKTMVLYVIYDSYGNALSQHSVQEEMIWKDIWSGGDSKNGELDLPGTPENPGSYILKLYFDGMFVAELPFTIQ